MPIVERLQGAWEGVVVGDPSNTKSSIKVDGTSFYFHRDRNFWFETSIAVPKARTSASHELHATITKSAKGQESSIGKTVVALFKIEGDTLTLAARGDGADEPPVSLDSTEDKGITHY